MESNVMSILAFLEEAGFAKSQASEPHADQTVYLRADGKGNSLQFNFAPNGLPGLPAWNFCAYLTVGGELQSLPMGGAVRAQDIRGMVEKANGQTSNIEGMTPERIQELADAKETQKFFFGSNALAEFTREHRNAHTGECVKDSGWYVVIHPSLDPNKRSFCVLSYWSWGKLTPISYDVPDPASGVLRESLRGIEILKIVAEKFRKMPNGGAVLNVLQDGAISNGVAIVAKFGNPKLALAALEQAGFDKRWNGWKAVTLTA